MATHKIVFIHTLPQRIKIDFVPTMYRDCFDILLQRWKRKRHTLFFLSNMYSDFEPTKQRNESTVRFELLTMNEHSHGIYGDSHRLSHSQTGSESPRSRDRQQTLLFWVIFWRKKKRARETAMMDLEERWNVRRLSVFQNFTQFWAFFRWMRAPISRFSNALTLIVFIRFVVLEFHCYSNQFDRSKFLPHVDKEIIFIKLC